VRHAETRRALREEARDGDREVLVRRLVVEGFIWVVLRGVVPGMVEEGAKVVRRRELLADVRNARLHADDDRDLGRPGQGVLKCEVKEQLEREGRRARTGRSTMTVMFEPDLIVAPSEG
jgi:hypothetical protein